MLRNTVITLVLVVLFGPSSVLAQSSDAVTACEALGTSDLVFIGRPRPAMMMKVSAADAIDRALEKRERAHEELIGTVATLEQFYSAPTEQQLELKRRFEIADEQYHWLLAQRPPTEVLMLQPVDVVNPIWGVSVNELFVWTTSFGELPVERAYLFYASRPFAFAPEIVLPERKPLDPAGVSSALTFLEQAASAKPGASVYGFLALEETVARHGSKKTRLAGVRLRLTVDGSVFESVTKSNGAFAFTGVPAGTIKIEAMLPDEMTIGDGLVIRENHGAGCMPVELQAKLNGRVQGRVLDGTGRPVSHQRVVLQDVQYPHRHHVDVKTNEEGEFSLTLVQPGTYLLVVVDNPLCERSFPPVFHPGTAARADATQIIVGRGTMHDGFELSLADRHNGNSAACETSKP